MAVRPVIKQINDLSLNSLMTSGGLHKKQTNISEFSSQHITRGGSRILKGGSFFAMEIFFD